MYKFFQTCYSAPEQQCIIHNSAPQQQLKTSTQLNTTHHNIHNIMANMQIKRKSSTLTKAVDIKGRKKAGWSDYESWGDDDSDVSVLDSAEMAKVNMAKLSRDELVLKLWATQEKLKPNKKQILESSLAKTTSQQRYSTKQVQKDFQWNIDELIFANTVAQLCMFFYFLLQVPQARMEWFPAYSW